MVDQRHARSARAHEDRREDLRNDGRLDHGPRRSFPANEEGPRCESDWCRREGRGHTGDARVARLPAEYSGIWERVGRRESGWIDFTIEARESSGPATWTAWSRDRSSTRPLTPPAHNPARRPPAAATRQSDPERVIAPPR